MSRSARSSSVNTNDVSKNRQTTKKAGDTKDKKGQKKRNAELWDEVTRAIRVLSREVMANSQTYTNNYASFSATLAVSTSALASTASASMTAGQTANSLSTGSSSGSGASTMMMNSTASILTNEPTHSSTVNPVLLIAERYSSLDPPLFPPKQLVVTETIDADWTKVLCQTLTCAATLKYSASLSSSRYQGLRALCIWGQFIGDRGTNVTCCRVYLAA